MKPSREKFFQGSTGYIWPVIILGLIVLCLLMLTFSNVIPPSQIHLILFRLGLIIMSYFVVRRLIPSLVITEKSIIHHQLIFFRKEIPWSRIKTTSYFVGSTDLLSFLNKYVIVLKGDNDELLLEINLLVIDNPLELIQAIDSHVPCSVDLGALDTVRKDRNRYFYFTLCLMNVTIPLLFGGSFSGAYTWNEGNRYAPYWMALFIIYLFFVIFYSIYVFKYEEKRKLFLIRSFIAWILIFIGPIAVEKNAYYAMKAVIAGQTGNLQEAEVYINKAIALRPEGYVAYYQTLGEIQFEHQDYNGTIKTFQYLLSRDASRKSTYHFWIGRSLVKLGRIEEAKKEFDHVRSINPSLYENEINRSLKGAS